jgi:hypothetical protein
VAGARRIFEKDGGEEEIVCRTQSFFMTSTHHWARKRRGYELFHPFSITTDIAMQTLLELENSNCDISLKITFIAGNFPGLSSYVADFRFFGCWYSF